MPQLINNANVVIRMKGLGILHHNENTGQWESIMLRDIHKHELKIIVRKIDSGGNQIGQEEIYEVPPDTKLIEITTNNNPLPANLKMTTLFNQVDNFSYDAINDHEQDSRWIIDLSEELHGKPVKLSNKTGGRLTLLTVSDATLYTYDRHDKPYTMVDMSATPLPLTAQRPKNPRLMASFVGMDITWNNENPVTEIKFDGNLEISLSSDDAVAGYDVLIDNNCPKDECPFPGDFRFYYIHLVDMGNEVFDETIPGLAGLTLPMNINELSDFENENVSQLFEGFRQLTEEYDGKTNDCGKALCTRLEGTDTLEDLIKP